MFEYIKGTVEELNPAETVIECSGIGYDIMISLQTFEQLKKGQQAKLFLYHYVKEDDEQLYGFAEKSEREIFKQLISISGVGVNTARVILSTLNAAELKSAIINEDVNRIKSVKGIGLKSAQRIILELKDKISKDEAGENMSSIRNSENEEAKEAAAALEMLGFSKPNVAKVVSDIIKKSPEAKVEEIIKEALKKL